MIRLTVLYNLPDDVEEGDFLTWRLGEHQRNNASMPHVVYTDFGRIVEGWPPGTVPQHRYMTTTDWPDWETFRSSFYAPQAQSKLREDVKRIRDYVYYVSEIMTSDGAIP